MHGRLKMIGVALGVVATLAIVVAIVHAAIPGAGGVVYGCYANNNGGLRVIDDSAACKNNETALNWNQAGVQGPQGTQGPQGAQGPQGSQGPQGATGASGVSGYEIVQVDFNLPAGNPGTGQIWQVDCSPGKVVLGGGVRLNGWRPDSVVRESGPNGNGWFVHIQNTSSDGGDTGAHVYAICANAN